MKRWKQALLFFVLLSALLLTQTAGTSRALAQEISRSTGVDAVLVIDCSGSLDKVDRSTGQSVGTDPEKISLEAAKLFVDMVEVSGSRVGMVAFSDVIEKTCPLTDINAQADKAKVKESIDSLPEDYTGDTDLGAAMEEALAMLTESADIGNTRTIILFTDGDVDLPRQGADAVQRSEQKARDCAQSAADQGIRVYTVGLNANNGLDDALIRELAEMSGGREYPASSAEDLPEIFFDVFAELIDAKLDPASIDPVTITDPDRYEERSFEIADGSVIEANIVITSDSPLTSVRLLDPEGTDASADPERVVMEQYSRITSLKLLFPESGTWTIQVQGQEGCTIGINLVMNYQVLLNAGVEDAEEQDKAVVTGFFSREGNALEDPDLYDQFTAWAVVTDEDGASEEFPMEYDGFVFTGEIPVEPGRSVTVSVHAESETLHKDSEEIAYTNGRLVSFEVAEINDITLNGLFPGMASEQVDLSKHFSCTDPKTVILMKEAAAENPDVVQVMLEGTTLTLKSGKSGSTTVRAAAATEDGMAEAENVFTVTVRNTFDDPVQLVLPVAGVIGGLILLILLIRLLTGGRRLRGSVTWEIRDKNDLYTDAMQKESALDRRRRKTNLEAVITDDRTETCDLYRITVTGTKNGILLKDKSDDCEILDAYGEAVMRLQAEDGTAFDVVCESGGGRTALVIRCVYHRN